MRWVKYYAMGTSMALVIAMCVLLAVPPWENRLACQFQVVLSEWTGFEGFRSSPYEGSFTGTVRFWDKWGTLRSEETLLNGQYHGLRKIFAEDGSLERMCEYKYGEAWNGVCWLREGKAFWAEFRDGLPFNGCTSQQGEGDSFSAECFIDGLQVSVDEFMKHHSLSQHEKESLEGIDMFSPSQWKMQTKAVLPAANVIAQ